MRHRLSTLATALLLAPPAMAQDAGGISSPLLSNCIAGVTLDTERTDSAYGTVALDGRPWLKIRDDNRKTGSTIFTVQAVGLGTWWQRDGTTVPFRFTCQLQRPGQTVKLQTKLLVPSLGDTLPPHSIVAGAASYGREILPSNEAELRVQLLDMSAPERPDIIAEQVVRTGWGGPTPFALRVPAGVPLAGRKLVISAMVVQRGQVRLRLKQPEPVGAGDLKELIALLLE